MFLLVIILLLKIQYIIFIPQNFAKEQKNFFGRGGFMLYYNKADCRRRLSDFPAAG